MSLGFFEEVEPAEKLVEIIKHANFEVVVKEIDRFLHEVAELEMEIENIEKDHIMKKERADNIAMRLMGAILSQNG